MTNDRGRASVATFAAILGVTLKPFACCSCAALGYFRRQSMIFRSLIRSILLFSLLGASSAAVAQHWTTIKHPTTYTETPFDSPPDVTPYFINIDTGFIYDAISFATPKHEAYCYRTTNAGMDWYPVDAFDQWYYTIRQIWFSTRERGYLVADTVDDTKYFKRGLLFETTDAGITWQQIAPDSLNVHSVYATGNTIFVTATPNGASVSAQRLGGGTFPFADSGSVYRSADLGATWVLMQTGLPQKSGAYPGLTEITGNRDSLVVVTAIDSLTQTYLIHSEDLGETWSYETLEIDGNNIWPGAPQLQAYCMPYSCNVVRVLNDYRLSVLDSFAFLEASPPFRSWKWILDKETGGWFAGTNCAQYICSAAGNLRGLFRLGDGTVREVGGPSEEEVDDNDFRNFSVVGHGAVVYGSDYGGSASIIERTTDGGDGSLTAAMLAPKVSVDHGTFGASQNADTVFVCDTGTIILVNRNMSCSLARLDSVSVTGIDPSSYSLTVVRDSRCRGIGDSTLIGIRRGFASSGPYTIRLFFSDDELNPFDTTFTRILVRRSSRLAFFFALPAQNISVHAGDTLSVPVIVNVDPDAPVTLSGNTHIGLVSTYNQNFLTPVAFTSRVMGITPDNGTATTNGIEYALMAPNGFSVKTGDTIGFFKFAIRLTDSVHSDFGLWVSGISSDDPRCVVASANQPQVSISLSPRCGDEILRNYMMTGEFTLDLKRVIPNPVSDVLHIEYVNHSSRDAEYCIVDALGATRMRGVLPSNRTNAEFPIRDLVPGLYLLKLTAPNALPVTSRILISR
jgi:hypothetical protein